MEVRVTFSFFITDWPAHCSTRTRLYQKFFFGEAEYGVKPNLAFF